MIHKLQDLCYAYAVADPVRDMLFALQDRIDELEAKRKPLTDKELFKIWLKTPSEEQDRYAFARAIEAAHGIKEGT